VFARAVAAQRGRLLAIADQSLRRLEVERRMNLVLEHAARQPGTAQDLLDQPHVAILARMAGSHDGQRLRPELVPVEAAGGHEWRQLERLGARAQKNEGVGIADRCDGGTVWRHHDHRPAVGRLHAVTAPDLHQHRRRRCGCASARAHPPLG
jgi:hypothetical protein